MSHRCRRMPGWPICGECGLPMPSGATNRYEWGDLDSQRNPETVDRDTDDNPDDITYGVLQRRAGGRP